MASLDLQDFWRLLSDYECVAQERLQKGWEHMYKTQVTKGQIEDLISRIPNKFVKVFLGKTYYRWIPGSKPPDPITQLQASQAQIPQAQGMVPGQQRHPSLQVFPPPPWLNSSASACVAIPIELSQSVSSQYTGPSLANCLMYSHALTSYFMTADIPASNQQERSSVNQVHRWVPSPLDNSALQRFRNISGADNSAPSSQRRESIGAQSVSDTAEKDSVSTGCPSLSLKLVTMNQLQHEPHGCNSVQLSSDLRQPSRRPSATSSMPQRNDSNRNDLSNTSNSEISKVPSSGVSRRQSTNDSGLTPSLEANSQNENSMDSRLVSEQVLKFRRRYGYGPLYIHGPNSSHAQPKAKSKRVLPKASVAKQKIASRTLKKQQANAKDPRELSGTGGLMNIATNGDKDLNKTRSREDLSMDKRFFPEPTGRQTCPEYSKEECVLNLSPMQEDPYVSCSSNEEDWKQSIIQSAVINKQSTATQTEVKRRRHNLQGQKHEKQKSDTRQDLEGRRSQKAKLKSAIEEKQEGFVEMQSGTKTKHKSKHKSPPIGNRRSREQSLHHREASTKRISELNNRGELPLNRNWRDHERSPRDRDLPTNRALNYGHESLLYKNLQGRERRSRYREVSTKRSSESSYKDSPRRVETSHRWRKQEAFEREAQEKTQSIEREHRINNQRPTRQRSKKQTSKYTETRTRRPGESGRRHWLAEELEETLSDISENNANWRFSKKYQREASAERSTSRNKRKQKRRFKIRESSMDEKSHVSSERKWRRHHEPRREQRQSSTEHHSETSELSVEHCRSLRRSPSGSSESETLDHKRYLHHGRGEVKFKDRRSRAKRDSQTQLNVGGVIQDYARGELELLQWRAVKPWGFKFIEKQSRRRFLNERDKILEVRAGDLVELQDHEENSIVGFCLAVRLESGQKGWFPTGCLCADGSSLERLTKIFIQRKWRLD